MESTQFSTSPAVKPFSAEKLKIALFRIALTGSAFLGVLTPGVASAGFFSLSGLLQALTEQTDASSSFRNSQTLSLLQPAINIDPNPSIGGGEIALVGGSALLPQEGPSGTAADIEQVKTYSTQISVYTVHPGDTLSGIAQMFDVSVNTIMWANDLKNGTIREGQTLVILPVTGLRYTVQKGDTVVSIAKKYKGDAQEIAQYNDLEAGATLSAGMSIIIPDGEVSVPTPTRSTATAPLRGASGPSLSGYYAWPVDGGVVTQGLHGYNGVDIGAPSGTAILAAAAGTVIIANGGGGWNGGYGNYVVIQHDNGTQTLYSHASSIKVQSGQRVAQGTTIATVGRTGKATGFHLHFEVRGATNPFSR